MFNITTGVILKIDAYFPNRNITILTDNSGIKVVSLSNLQQYFHNYYILDVWTFIVYYFNKIVINSETKYHNNTTLNFLLNCYQELISNSSNLEKIYVFLLFHTLSLQGIQFNFKNWINCGANSSIIDFNSQLGGIICYNCFGPSLVITNNLPLFNTLMKLNNINNWKITQKELKYIINILEFHCQIYSGIPIIRINKHL